jgi:dipeptidyl aminopeptidase/acylaminoacyl peptidase
MRFWVGLVGASALLGAVLAGPAASADLALYGRLPSLELMALSPDGKSLAEIRTDGDNRQLFVNDADTGAKILALNAGSKRVRNIKWIDDDNLILTLSTTRQVGGMLGKAEEYFTCVLLNTRLKVQRAILTDLPGPSMNVVLDVPEARVIDGKAVMLSQGVTFHNDGVEMVGERTVIRTNLTDGRSALVAQGNDDTAGYLIGAEGQILAQNLYNDHNGVFSLRMRGPDGLRTVSLPDGIHSAPNLEGLSHDGAAAIVSYRKGDAIRLAQLSQDGSWTTLAEDYYSSRPVFDPKTQRLMALASTVDGKEHLSFIDPSDQKQWTAIVKAFSDEDVSLVDVSADHRRWVIHSDSPTVGETFALIDTQEGKIKKVDAVYESLKPEDVSPVQAVSYKAADGTPLAGFLTLPRSGRKSESPPPHRVPSRRTRLQRRPGV